MPGRASRQPTARFGVAANGVKPETVIERLVEMERRRSPRQTALGRIRKALVPAPLAGHPKASIAGISRLHRSTATPDG
jgi:hypothetical protein